MLSHCKYTEALCLIYVCIIFDLICLVTVFVILWLKNDSYLLPPQALLGGGHQMDLTKFQYTLWDILTKGDSVKVSSIIRPPPTSLFVFFNFYKLYSSFTPSLLYSMD